VGRSLKKGNASPLLKSLKGYTTVTLTAARPFSPCSISKVTFVPSLKDLKPVALIAL
jgi:hypothetical protein